jgi:hypothetical protein
MINVDFEKYMIKLYHYFKQKGKKSWYVKLHFIAIALRYYYDSLKNKYSYEKSKKIIEEWIESKDPNICFEYKGNYIKNQEWQLEIKEGMILMDKQQKIYKIKKVYDSGFLLEHVVTKLCMTINWVNENLIFGDFQHNKNNDEILKLKNKEFNDIVEKYNNDIIRNKKLKEKFLDNINTYKNSVEYNTFHHQKCLTKNKISCLNFERIPLEIISKIVSFGLDKHCNHKSLIKKYDINLKKEEQKLLEIQDIINYDEYLINKLKAIKDNKYEIWLNSQKF